MGLQDFNILNQIAAEYELSGRLGEAADVLKWACSIPPFSFEVRNLRDECGYIVDIFLTLRSFLTSLRHFVI